MRLWLLAVAFTAGAVAALVGVTYGVSRLFGVPEMPVLLAAWAGANLQAIGTAAAQRAIPRGA